MITAPRCEEHTEKQTLGIRSRAPISDFPTIIPAHHSEVFAFLRAQGIAPDGPPFMRLHVVNMEGLMDVEMGVPVATAQTGNGRIAPGTLPAGTYAELIYTGLDGMPGNAALIEWAKENGITFDQWDDPNGDAFRCRVEFFLTDPDTEPNPDQWETLVAIKITAS